MKPLKWNNTIRISWVLAQIILVNTASAQEFELAGASAGLESLTRTIAIAIADYDRDGDHDLFFVAHPSFDPSDPSTWNRLMQNQGDGTYEDVTLGAGFASQYANTGIPATLGEKMGASWGDYDNDGYPDLFLANSREDQLYHNEGDGTFIEVTEQAGVAGCNDCYSPSGLWWDHDRDGDLDLYVNNLRGPNRLYENQGDGTFEDVTARTGLGGDGVTWASTILDVGRDGFLDLYNMNDTQINEFFENRSGQKYNEVSRAYRLADEGAGMGVAVGDYNNDGFFDIYITNIFNHQPNPLFHNTGDRRFLNAALEVGVENAGWGWGTQFFDCDHDGDEDLYACTGTVSKQFIDGFEQTDVDNFFFKNMLKEGGLGFENWSVASNTDGSARGRGVETFDYDDDGDLDLFIANVEDPVYLYKNRTINQGQDPEKNWIQIELEGTTSNRDAIGTEVKITVGDETYYRWYVGAAIFGQSLKPVHFGIGSATVIDEIQITWPLGRKEIIQNVDVNQRVRYIEGQQNTITGLSRRALQNLEVKGFPNPFTHYINFDVELNQPGTLDFKVYTISGAEVYTSTTPYYQVGQIQFQWDGEDHNGTKLPAGRYLYHLSFNDQMNGGTLILER